MSPILRFEQQFIEEAVYQAIDSDKRLTEFFRIETGSMNSGQKIEETFQKLGFQQAFEKLISEFPLLANTDVTISIKRVFSLGQEGSRLNDSKGKEVVLGLLTRRLLNHAFLEIYLRCELLRASDMLDPLFSYKPIPDHGLHGSEESVRCRFFALWDLYISSRLGYEGIRIRGHGDEDRSAFQITGFHFKKDTQYPDKIADQLNRKGFLSQKDLLQLAY